MIIFVRFFVLSLLTFVMSCASGVKIKYDEERNFREYEAYSFLPRPEKKFVHLTNPEAVKLKIDEKVTHSLKLHLKRGGFIESKENPDFFVAFHTGLYDRVSAVDWGYFYPRNVRYHDGRDDIELHYFREGALVIDFVDAKTKAFIWRGSLKRILEYGKLQNDKVKERIDNAVEKIISKFPPEK